MTRIEAKRRAKELGIPFAEFQAMYRELRILHRVEREREWAIRQNAWERMSPKGCHEFWRHGFSVRFPRAFCGGDRNMIKNFDVVADGMKYEFPELERDDDPAATLFEMLAKPHNRLPSSEETWDQVISLAEAGELRPVELEAAPF